MKKSKKTSKSYTPINSDMERIGKNINIIRVRTGQSLESFSEWLGVSSEETVRRIENGCVPAKAGYLFLLAKELKIPIEEIVSSDLNLDIGKDFSIGKLLDTPYLINERIAQNIRNARQNKLYSQKELAENLGWKSEKKIYRMEQIIWNEAMKEEKPLINIYDLICIADALELPVVDLFTGCE